MKFDDTHKLQRIFESIVEKDLNESTNIKSLYELMLREVADEEGIDVTLEKDDTIVIGFDLEQIGNRHHFEDIFNDVLDRVERITPSEYFIDDNFDDSYISISKNGDKSDKSEEEYNMAKKLGYFGKKEEAIEWLHGDYGKEELKLYNTFLKIKNGDEDEAIRLYDFYGRLMSGFNKKWNGKTSEEHLEDFKKDIGNSEEANKLVQNIIQKYKESHEIWSKYVV